MVTSIPITMLSVTARLSSDTWGEKKKTVAVSYVLWRRQLRVLQINDDNLRLDTRQETKAITRNP